ncbi:MAG: VOC family protein [Euryarchaeota archaeon]|nr:VOC family protein [Euryarchaeota archaeon]
MDLNHLHLHVRDIPRARRFYETYFGFRRDTVKEDEFLIVRNPAGFDLAFMEDPEPSPMPRWFHFGFRLPTRKAVEELHDRMAAEGVAILRPVRDHGAWMSFVCTDPDGYAIEVYYE